jgi:hypothetical protein
MIGHTTDSTRLTTIDQAITTSGTKRFPLKKDNASGSLRKL